MADRHFDLNKALADAEAKAHDDESWLTFDLGPNYLPPTPAAPEPASETAVEPAGDTLVPEGADADEPPPEPAAEPSTDVSETTVVPQPWRINRVLPGWLVIKYITAPTTTQSLALAGHILEQSFDPDQWPQFEQFLYAKKVPLEVLDALLLQIVRDQIGLPLDH